MDATLPETVRADLRKFRDPTVCMALAVKTRWPTGFCCPICTSSGWKLEGRDVFECQQCKSQTSITAGTLLHGSHVSIQSWIAAAYLMSYPSENKVPPDRIRVAEMKRQIRVSSDQTLWKIKTTVRKAMFKSHAVIDAAIFSSEFEIRKITVGAQSMVVGAILVENVNKSRQLYLVELHSQARADKAATIQEIVGRAATVMISKDHPRLDRLKQAGRMKGIRFIPIPANELRCTVILQRLENWIKTTSQKLHPELRQGVLAEFAFRENHQIHHHGFSKLLAALLSPTP